MWSRRKFHNDFFNKAKKHELKIYSRGGNIKIKYFLQILKKEKTVTSVTRT